MIRANRKPVNQQEDQAPLISVITDQFNVVPLNKATDQLRVAFIDHSAYY